jgi:hypothetical protein
MYLKMQKIQLHLSWILIPYAIFRFLEELDEGVFIQQTLETLLVNADGKQLMVCIV